MERHGLGRVYFSPRADLRDDGNYWQQVEAHVSAYSRARFSHGICPGCFDQFVEPSLNDLKRSPK